MIDKNHFRAGLAVFLALAVPGAQAASTLELSGSKAICSGLFDVGAQKVELTGSNEKFSEYRDMRDGFLVNEVLLSVQGSDKPYFFDFEARNAVRGSLTPVSRDASYKVAAGRYGKYKFTAMVDRTPHNFGEGKFLLSGAGSGHLGIASDTQKRLQAVEQTRQERGGVSLTDTTGEDAQQRDIILGLLNAAGPTRFGLDREKGALAAEFTLPSDAKTWVKFSEETRKGFRQIGMGTYERYAQGATAVTHLEDQFVTEGLEIAEPIDYKTQTLNAGVGVYKKSWSADLEYTFTEFTQRLTSLIWENPFRDTDATAVNNAGVANNAYERGRFVRGQFSLPPTSQSHDVALSGSVELPAQSRLTGAVGVGMTQQNNALLPYTLNTALAGVSGGPTNITDPSALLVSRFNGEARTLTGSLALSSRPTDKLRTALKYRYYDYANRSDVILFPGYAAYGESFWRTWKNDTDNADAMVSNEPGSYTRQTGEVSADYEVLEPLTVDVGAFYDQWDYRQTRVEKNDEYGANAGFGLHVGHLAKVHGGVKAARRTVTGYRAGNQGFNPEAIGLANYNWADRKRKKANLGVGVTPTETLSFGLDGAYQHDELGAQERFGLKDVKSAVVAFDATYEPSEKVALSFDYSREQRRSMMQNGAKDDKFNSGIAADDDWEFNDPFNPVNYWNDTITEDVDTIGFEATVRPQEKLDVTAGYNFSLSRMAFGATNPNGADASAAGYDGTKLRNGVAQTWPSVVSRLHEIRVRAGYEIVKDLKVGGSYLFSRYSLNDFANAGSYLPGTSPENTTKYVFAGANQLGYTAHVVGTYVAWKF